MVWGHLYNGLSGKEASNVLTLSCEGERVPKVSSEAVCVHLKHLWKLTGLILEESSFVVFAPKNKRFTQKSPLGV